MPAACRDTLNAPIVRCSLPCFISGKGPPAFQEVIKALVVVRKASETNKWVNPVTAIN